MVRACPVLFKTAHQLCKVAVPFDTPTSSEWHFYFEPQLLNCKVGVKSPRCRKAFTDLNDLNGFCMYEAYNGACPTGNPWV